ncbi:MAG: helix-turn-helix domain-containing protein [Bacteroidota bacterium]
MISAILDVLVLFGITLSFFLVALIFSSKSFRSDVHKYFALTIVSLSFCLTYTYFDDLVPASGILEIISWDFLFPFAFVMYCLKAIKHPLGQSKQIWLLALPFFLLSILQTSIFIFDFDLFEWITDGDEEKIQLLIEIRVFSFLPFSVILISFAYLKIRKAHNIYKREKQWLLFNCLFLIFYFLCWIFGDSIEWLFGFVLWQYLLAVLAIFLIVVTYIGIHHLNISEQRRQIQAMQVIPLQPSTPSDSIAIPSGVKQAMVSQKMEDRIQKLNTIMAEDSLYQNPNLTRTIVAKSLGISEGYLSELLKSRLHTNFNDYVNEFRVKRVIEMFHDRQFDLFSIEAIGFEAGFKTKSVFYNAFKKVTQKTPGAYRKWLNAS